jgi:flagellar export protein FliJ
MKTKFKFEILLTQRMLQKDLALRDATLAEIAFKKQMALIEDLYRQASDARRSLSDQTLQGHAGPKELLQLEEFIKLQGIKIQIERLKSRELLADLEDKQEVLSEKAKDFKVIERLKEREIERQLHEAKAKEAQFIEEITMLRSSRRGNNA